MFPSEAEQHTKLRNAEIDHMMDELEAYLESSTTSPIAVRRQDLVRMRILLRENKEYIGRLQHAFIDMHDQRDRHNEIYHK